MGSLVIENPITFLLRSCLLVLAVARTYNIDVGPGLSFSPVVTTGVVQGDTIRFSFKAAGHTAGLLTGPASQCAFQGWRFPSSGVSAGGEQFTLTVSPSNGFTGAGTFDFGCSPHCNQGMRGSIVLAGGATTAPLPSSTTVPAGGGASCVPRTLTIAVGPGGSRIFSPSFVSAVLGDSIVFDFQSAGHNARSDLPGLTPCDFSTAWTIPITPAGSQVTLAVSAANGFQTGSTMQFACEPHCGSNMAGQISVVACGSAAVNGSGNSSSVPSLSGGGLFLRPILIAHIVLMSLAFAFFMLLGAVPASFSFGAWWFPAHWFMMSMAIVLATVGFVVIVVEVEGNGVGHFSSLLGSPTAGTHPLLGVIIVGLVFCQVGAGVVANYWWQHKNGKGMDTSRPAVVDHLHRWLGRLVLILSIVQVFLGVREALLPDWVYGAFAAWYGVVVAITIILIAARVFKFRTLGALCGGGGSKDVHHHEQVAAVQKDEKPFVGQFEATSIAL